MTKPVTTVAAMILVDDGKLDLDAPVARYLPEIGNMPCRGVRPRHRARPGSNSQKRPMTVRDLLRHTSGVIYPEMDFAFPERGLCGREHRVRTSGDPHDLWLEGRVPARQDAGGLRVEPGRVCHWFISPVRSMNMAGASDVLARVVEVASVSHSTSSCRARSLRRCRWSIPASSSRKTSSTAWSILRCRSDRRSGISRRPQGCFPVAAAWCRLRPTICAFARCF